MERKLAAILSADVQGYSRLMEDNEEATIRTLTIYREVMISLIQQHRGRVVDSPGDNVLAEFASAVDAVQGALAIQWALEKRNAEIPGKRQMHYRIGINVGDVVVEGKRIYGDGVNIAARLESLAEGGGVCISGSVYEQVENKLALRYISQGEQTVKNIARPIWVYKVEPEAGSPPPTPEKNQTPVLPLPDKPSIAVLPFSNLSADPGQGYFSDGITEDLITSLSKVSGLFVIARHSVFTYKSKEVTAGQVGRELGVQYVVEGSLRKAGNRLRINVQLIDAPTNGHLWAERYDRELTDIFALQDEIIQKIVFALQVNLLPEEQVRFRRAPTTKLEAYDFYLRAESSFWQGTKDSNAQARQLFEKAIELDPAYGAALARLGMTYLMDWFMQWSHNPHYSPEHVFELVQKALILDDSAPIAHLAMSEVALIRKHHEQAIVEAEQAIALDPNYAEGYARLGEALACAGRPAETIGWLEKAIRLNPREPTYYSFILGHTYILLEQYEKAVTALQRAVVGSPDFIPAHVYLAVAYIELGQQEAARTEVVRLAHLAPPISLEVARKRLPYKDPAVTERILDSLYRKAGTTLRVRDYVSLLTVRLLRYLRGQA